MKKWLLFLLFTSLAYGLSLRYGFSQDDYYFLTISQPHSLVEFLQFFSPWHQQGFPFYRPLGTQLYFFLFSRFGVYASLAMHVFMLIIQSLSGYQVYRLTQRLSKDRYLPYLVGISYCVAAAHFLSLYYIAATQQLLAALFSFISLNYFMNKNPLRAGVFLLLALLSKENAILVPVIAALIYQFNLHNSLKLKSLIKDFAPFALVTLFYLLIRLVAGVSVQSEYHPDLSLSLVSTLRWYYLFSFNAPELLLNYAGSNLFINYFRFVHDFGVLALVNSLSSLILAIATLIIFVRSLFTRSPLKKSQLLLFILWWLTGIILIIWFPTHRYPHYLDLSLPPILLSLYLGFKGRVRFAIFLLFVAGALSGIELSRVSHWTTGRAEMASRAEDYFESHNLCQYDSIFFTGDPAARELSYTLSIENGPNDICSPDPIQPRVYYQGVTEIPATPSVIINAKEIVN